MKANNNFKHVILWTIKVGVFTNMNIDQEKEESNYNLQ